MENVVIKERLAGLRESMKNSGIDYYMMPTSDFHNSEYAADFFKVREYFCGFTGSNGTLVVSQDWAGIWTDGRYFIQCAKEIEGTGVTMFRMGDAGVPTIKEYLVENMKEGQVLGFDGRVITSQIGLAMEKALSDKKVTIKYGQDLAEGVWTDRPKLPCHDMYVLSDELCGKSFKDKLADVRAKMKENKCQAHLLCKLDDIMWLTNLRGNDVECNPVALSYAYMTEDEFYLFVQKEEVTKEVEDYCKANDIQLRDYHSVVDFIAGLKNPGQVMIDKKNVNYTVFRTLSDVATIVDVKDPTTLMKAMKNDVEIKNIREVYLRDSAALVKFMYWVKTNVGKIPMNEYSVAMHLDKMRSELPGYIELSFPTISAYKANAAMMHYEATEGDYAEIHPEGMLLVDSGGTYMGGTTDVTRTMVLGPISDEIKKHYTHVCMGMLRLANARFLHGCYGRNLDILARGPIWNMDMDYKCGTGHGIGYMLNVHEGPHNIRWAFREGMEDNQLEKGMIVSDEPGVYIADSHGIRIENILEVVEGVNNSDGQFMHFEQLTYAPIDLEAIDTSYMEKSDIKALNDYHAAVFEKVAPLIEEPEIVEWLKEQTRPVQ